MKMYLVSVEECYLVQIQSNELSFQEIVFRVVCVQSDTELLNVQIDFNGCLWSNRLSRGHKRYTCNN